MPDFITSGPQETRELGRKIGALLKKNDVIALSGMLGSGKTTFVQGIAEGLGISAQITSPSFIIINEYSGRTPLYHVDLYRLQGENEIEDLDLADYFSRGGITAVEWSEKYKSHLPKNVYNIGLENLGDDKRKLCLPLELAAQLK